MLLDRDELEVTRFAIERMPDDEEPILQAKLFEKRRLDSDPKRNSLGLLRSRPDPVGEDFVHRQPPDPYIAF